MNIFREQALPTLMHQDGQREREPPVYSAPSQASSLPPQRPSLRSAFDNLDMARSVWSFQPYKPHRRQESGGYFLPQLREYKDAILIPVRSEVPPLVDQYRGMLSYHHHLHQLDTPLNLNINPTPIRPTPHRQGSLSSIGKKKTPLNLSFGTQRTPIFSLKSNFCTPLERK